MDDLPDAPVPTPDTQLLISVRTPGDQHQVSPSTIDTIEAEASRRLRKAGVTDTPVHAWQDTEMERGPRDTMPDLNAIEFDIGEKDLSFDQVNRAVRAIVASMRDYGVYADEENVYLRCNVRMTVSLPG